MNQNETPLVPTKFVFLLILFFANTSFAARSDGNIPSTTSNPGSMSAMPRPETGMTAQHECEVHFDCANAKLTIKGQDAGKISCGPQTAQSVSKGTLPKNTNEASGNSLLPKGFPIMTPEPLICPNCVIHLGAVGDPTSTHGCVHVDNETWNKLRSCGGSSFTITPGRVQEAGRAPASNEAPR